MKKFMIFVIAIMIIGAFTIPSFADTYNAELEIWENDEEIPTNLSDNDLYDWEIEHGFISEAREQYCPNCSVWAKYGTCPICNEIVWGKIETKNSISTQKISTKSTKQKKVAKKSKAKKTVKKSKAMTNAKAKKIIMTKKKIHIDKIKLVDKYVKGKWYCYYIYADGDCYVATIKRGKIQKFVQLN